MALHQLQLTIAPTPRHDSPSQTWYVTAPWGPYRSWTCCRLYVPLVCRWVLCRRHSHVLQRLLPVLRGSSSAQATGCAPEGPAGSCAPGPLVGPRLPPKRRLPPFQAPAPSVSLPDFAVIEQGT